MKLFTSSRKSEVNIANAQKSTGPRTEEGKAKVAKNAFKHGLASANLFVPEALKPLFDEITETLREEIEPEGALEEDAFQQLRNARFQMERILILQGELARQSAERGLDPLLDPEVHKQYDRLERYHRAAQSTSRTYMNELARLQTERAMRVEAFAEENEIPALASYKAVASVGARSRKLLQNKATEAMERFFNAPVPTPRA